MQTNPVTSTKHEERRTSTRRTLDLDALSRMDSDALGRLFAEGKLPESLSELDGHPRGRMLAVRRLDRGPLSRVLRRFAAAARFPWGGKSFHARSADEGKGINRVHLGGRHQLFPFETRISASAVDGDPAVVLDYDLPDNPGFIRAIHDEVRLVDRGLYLGPAMWKTADGPVLVLWFALDTETQSRGVGERERS
jgi:hypothetical protein